MTDSGDAREKLLDAAERLFAGKGYAGVTLRDIASELGLSHTSLYYHFPGGKEELYEKTLERGMLNHGAALAALLQRGASLRDDLRVAADWFLAHPPLDLIRLTQSDLPALPEAAARRLMELMYAETIQRLGSRLEAAAADGVIAPGTDCGLVAGAFIGLTQSLHAIPARAEARPRPELARELIDILLKGLDYKGGE